MRKPYDIVLLVTFAGLMMTSATTMAQNIDVLAPPTQTEAIQTQDKDLGLSELKLGENPWVSVISRNDVGMTYAAHLSRAGLGLGPDTKALLGEIRDAEIRTSSEVRRWMEPSLRMIEGRIKDTNWRHEFSTGGPATTSTTKRYRVGGNTLSIESGTAEKSLSVKLTYLPTMESKTFFWSVKYSSENITDLSYARAFSSFFRSSGLPSFSMTTWDQNRSNPRIRRGLVAVSKLWEKFERKGIPEMKKWMEEVSSK